MVPDSLFDASSINNEYMENLEQMERENDELYKECHELRSTEYLSGGNKYPNVLTKDKLDQKKNNDGNIIETHINEDGTTSNYFDKRKLKVAPRSTLQFKIGPPFEKVSKFSSSYYSIVNDNTAEILDIKLTPRIDRGFDFIENEWIGYKRNYFTLISTFETPGLNLNDFLNSSYSIALTENNYIKVKYFAIKIEAKSNEYETKIDLIQHTAKRDKGPHFKPQRYPLVPSTLPQHQIIREASNVRNITKMQKYDSTFHFHRDDVNWDVPVDSILSTYPEDCIRKVARYERVQFASSMNIKNSSQKNKYFRLHVKLGVVINKSDTLLPEGCSFDFESDQNIFVPIIEMKTPELIIRGRSPSNYAISQRVTIKKSSIDQSGTASTTTCSKGPKNLQKKKSTTDNEGNQSENINDQSVTNETGDQDVVSAKKKTNRKNNKSKNLILKNIDLNAKNRPAIRHANGGTFPIVRPKLPSSIKNVRKNSRTHSDIQKSTIKKIEMLKHIETKMQMQSSLFEKNFDKLVKYNNNNNKCTSEDELKQTTVDMKDVELMPIRLLETCSEKVSLQLPLSIDKILSGSEKKIKRNKIKPVIKNHCSYKSRITKRQIIISKQIDEHNETSFDVSECSFNDDVSMVSYGINKLKIDSSSPHGVVSILSDNESYSIHNDLINTNIQGITRSSNEDIFFASSSRNKTPSECDYIISVENSNIITIDSKPGSSRSCNSTGNQQQFFNSYYHYPNSLCSTPRLNSQNSNNNVRFSSRGSLYSRSTNIGSYEFYEDIGIHGFFS